MGYHIGLFKLIIIVPNVLIFCLGCIMVGISADVIKNKAGKFNEIKDENILPDGVKSSAALGLAAGIFLGLVSFIAVCGVLTANQNRLICYAVILGIILLFEIIGAAVAFVKRHDMNHYFLKYLYGQMDDYNGGVEENNQLIGLQLAFGCCGVRSNRDWLSAKNWTAYVNKTIKGPYFTNLPVSCCGFEFEAEESLDCKINIPSTIDIRSQEGCYYKIQRLLPATGVMLSSIFGIQIIIFVVICWLKIRIKEDRLIKIF